MTYLKSVVIDNVPEMVKTELAENETVDAEMEIIKHIRACGQQVKEQIMEIAIQRTLLAEKYKGVIKRFQNSSMDNEFIWLEVPTEKRPWVTITMSRCTVCIAVQSMGSEDKMSSFDKIPEVVSTTDDDGNPVGILADHVKELRRRTGRGMMECKKALLLTVGDMDEAVIYLKKHV